MDPGHFDAWTKTLVAGAASRRTTLRSLIGVALSAAIARSSVREVLAECAAPGEPCVPGPAPECCSGLCATNGTCCLGKSAPEEPCHSDRQCCSGRCEGGKCQCRRDERLCRGVCIRPGQCCSESECREGEVCTDFEHVCCPSERVATHSSPSGSLETCGCCCTNTGCTCPCGDRCRKVRGECVKDCCCNEDLCECPPLGTAYPYTSCCSEGSLGDVGGVTGCCTDPLGQTVCPAIARAR